MTASDVSAIACPQAEAAFLGCLLVSGDFLTSCYLRQVEPADFTDPRHEAVVRCMQTLRARGDAVDPITVLGELRRTGLDRSMTADRSAGVFLADLAAAPPSIGNAGHYLLVVLEHRLRREVERIATMLLQAAPTSDLDDLREMTRKELGEVSRIFGRVAKREPCRTETELEAAS